MIFPTIMFWVCPGYVPVWFFILAVCASAASGAKIGWDLHKREGQ